MLGAKCQHYQLHVPQSNSNRSQLSLKKKKSLQLAALCKPIYLKKIPGNSQGTVAQKKIHTPHFPQKDDLYVNVTEKFFWATGKDNSVQILSFR